MTIILGMALPATANQTDNDLVGYSETMNLPNGAIFQYDNTIDEEELHLFDERQIQVAFETAGTHDIVLEANPSSIATSGSAIIIFNNNGHEELAVPESVTVETSSIFTLAYREHRMSLDGFEFSGWLHPDSVQVIFPGQTVSIIGTGTIELFALLSPIDPLSPDSGNYVGIAPLSNPNIVNPSVNGQIMPFENLQVRWSPVSGASTYILSLRNLTTNQLRINQQNTGNTTSFVVTQSHLVAGHNFRVAVASRVNGVERWTERTFSIRAQANQPGAPTNVSASAGNGSATINWHPPTSNGGSAITGYQVSRDGNNWTSLASTARTHTFSGLANGTSVTLRVRAVNARGAGTIANAPAVTPRGVPGVPISVLSNAGNGSATITWQPPVTNGGSAITGYQVSRDGNNWITLGASTRAHTFSSLPNGVSVTLRVRAVNAIGSGPIAQAPPAMPINNVTLTFNANGGTPATTTLTRRAGVTIGTLPANPTRTGLTFAGWWNTSAATGGTQIMPNTVVPNANTTYWARWNATVTFNANGGSVSPTTRTVAVGTTVGTLPTPTRSGHTFAGWWSAQTGGTQITASTVVNGNVTYWARWNASNVTLTFNANGGAPATMTLSRQAGTTIGNMPAHPTRTGLTFAGWWSTSAATGGTQITSNTVVPNVNTTFWARWNATITFNANGGAVIPPSRTATVGAPIGTLPIPTRSGHTFAGWWTAQTGGAQITANTVVNGNVTYWARWSPNVTLTFNANGGTPATMTLSRQAGTTIGNMPAHPTRSGLTFAGWWSTSAATGGTQITANTVVPNANTTYWARWNATITFNANGGTVSPAMRAVLIGATVGTLPTPTRSGHTFAGWWTTQTGGTQITANTAVNNNVTYWARWTVSLTFDANGGTPATSTLNRVSGNTIGTLPEPTRSGHRFDGWWSTSAAIGGTRIESGTPTPNANTTYWARWTPLQNVAVTFNANGGTVSPTTRSVQPGSMIGVLPTPTRSGYVFVGWFTAQMGGAHVTTSTIVNDNVTYWARWSSHMLRLVPNTLNLDSPAFSATVNVLTNATWSIPVSTVDWITITEITPTSRAGSGSFRINVAANTARWAMPRTGMVAVSTAGSQQTITVTQSVPIVTMNYNILVNSWVSHFEAQTIVNDVKPAFMNTFNIHLARGTTTTEQALNQRPGCLKTLNIACSAACGPINECRTRHHRSGNYFVSVRRGTPTRSNFKFVNFRMCSYRYDESVHIVGNGFANARGGDTIIASTQSDNVRRTTAHEISHLFGATDGNCSHRRCVMTSGAPYHDLWCDFHRNQIFAYRNR